MSQRPGNRPPGGGVRRGDARCSLEREKWPPNRRLTEQARKADVAVHALPERARAAASDAARGGVYVDLVTTCASCHTLGKGAWGPRSPLQEN